jgi:hypothetical protein
MSMLLVSRCCWVRDVETHTCEVSLEFERNGAEKNVGLSENCGD